MKKVIGWNLSQELRDIMKNYGGKRFYCINQWIGIKTIDRNLIEALARRAKKLGFEPENNKSNKVYRNSKAGIVLILSGKRYKNHFFTIVSEKHYDEEIKGYAVRLINKTEKGKVVMRPAIWKNGAYIFLWKFDYREVEVDHITKSHLINTPSLLRSCTRSENMRNLLYRTDIAQSNAGFKFVGEYQLEDVSQFDFSVETNKGHDVLVINRDNRIFMTSKLFTDEDEMYRELNCWENKVLGEFRYNPILACENILEEILLLEWLFFGTLTEEEYKYAKLYALKKRPDPKGYDIFKYYDLEQEVL